MAGQPIALESLDVQQLAEVGKQLESEIDGLMQNALALQQTAAKFAGAGQAVEYLQEQKQGGRGSSLPSLAWPADSHTLRHRPAPQELRCIWITARMHARNAWRRPGLRTLVAHSPGAASPTPPPHSLQGNHCCCH